LDLPAFFSFAFSRFSHWIHAQDYVDNAVFGNTQKKGHPKVVVRVVSNVQRLQESTPGFTKKYGKKVFPYQLKNIMCFMECGDGTDVCFLALVVAGKTTARNISRNRIEMHHSIEGREQRP
jgi:hypothetical protein